MQDFVHQQYISVVSAFGCSTDEAVNCISLSWGCDDRRPYLKGQGT